MDRAGLGRNIKVPFWSLSLRCSLDTKWRCPGDIELKGLELGEVSSLEVHMWEPSCIDGMVFNTRDRMRLPRSTDREQNKSND